MSDKDNVVELFQNQEEPLYEAMKALLPLIKEGKVKGFCAIAFIEDEDVSEFEYLIKPGEVTETELIGALEILKQSIIFGGK